MIQINLLPVQEAAKKKSGKQVYILGALLLIFQGIMLFTMLGDKQAELSQIRQKNALFKQKIDQIKKRTSKVQMLEKTRDELEGQKKVLDNLSASQSGPVLLLAEVAEMLTQSNDAVSRANMKARKWTPTWNPSELWLDQFIDKQRKISIAGHALDQKAVSEFWRRLKNSKHFVNVRLVSSRQVKIAKLKGRTMMQFVFEALALYGEADVERYLACELGPDDKNSKKKRK